MAADSRFKRERFSVVFDSDSLSRDSHNVHLCGRSPIHRRSSLGSCRYLRDARRHHTLRQSYRRRRPAQIPDAPAPAAAARLHWPSMLHVAAEVAALAVARLPVACIPIGS